MLCPINLKTFLAFAEWKTANVMYCCTMSRVDIDKLETIHHEVNNFH